MFLNVDHKKYDFAMEVLCLLPHDPAMASMADLREDLRVENQRPIQDAIKTLVREHNLDIRTTNMGVGKSRGATIRWDSRKHAVRLGEKYFETVYGG